MNIAAPARLAIRFLYLIVALALPSLATQAATAPAFEWIKLQENASSADAINIIISSEGYTASQRTLFLADAQLIVNGFANKEPWKTYISHVNFYAGWAVSNQEGISVVGGTQVDTAFKGTLDLNPVAGPFDLKLNTDIVYAYMQSVTVNGQHIFIVNSTAQSPSGMAPLGTGGRYAVFLRDSATSNNLIAPIALHETAHSIVGLSDEYVGGGDISPLKNKTYDITNIPWKLWLERDIPLPTPDSYATDTPPVSNRSLRVGAYKQDIATFYRPTWTSMMTGAGPGAQFGPVNSEAIILAIYSKTGPLISVTPTATSVRILSGQKEDFIPTKWAAPTTITTKWYIDNSTTTHATSDTLTLSYADLAPGLHTLKCVVKDETPMVRNDPKNLTEDTISWTVVIGDLPLITQQPADVSVTAGQPASFSVTATGSSLSYQWRKGGTAISSATAATYTINSTSTADASTYTCVVTNSSGSATSTAATLTVNAGSSSSSSGGSSGGGGGACGEGYLLALALCGLVRYWQKKSRQPARRRCD